MKALIADNLPESCLGALRVLGLDVVFEPGLSADDLPDAIADASVLVVRSTKVSAATIERATSLNLIVRAGAGVNTIDLAAASGRGVFVANCPGKNAIAVAELAVGLLIAADRRIPDNVADLRQGVWNKKAYGQGRGLYGRRLGVLGTGTIGLEVIRRAQAFGMQCVCWSRSLEPTTAKALGVTYAESPMAVAVSCDHLTVHLAKTTETTHLVDAELLGALPDGAIVVHTARGGVVDDGALAAEVRSGRLLAALDVYEDEPTGGTGEYAGEIGRLDGVYGTHHIGASTAQAQEAVSEEVVRIVRTYLTTGEVNNVVNLCKQSPAQWQLTVRHYDRVGVLASVLDRLKTEDINVQELSNIIFDGAQAASASIRLDRRPTEALLDGLRNDAERIIHVDLLALR